MSAAFADCGDVERTGVAPLTTTTTKPKTGTTIRPRHRVDPPVPAALFAENLDLRAGPVPVPLRLSIPSIHVTTQVLGVGVTPSDVMDAPVGPVGDPVWQEAFWYRGSAVPGAISTALIAGHIDGPRGTSAVFGDIGRLRAGDAIVVHDTRTGLDVRFAVTRSMSFTLDEASRPNVLKEIYGVGPVAGTTPQRSKDGLAHLTLVTCSGTFQKGIGTHDHRLAVFATRVP
jgi:sortase (surface protein transpeptidase)